MQLSYAVPDCSPVHIVVNVAVLYPTGSSLQFLVMSCFILHIPNVGSPATFQHFFAEQYVPNAQVSKSPSTQSADKHPSPQSQLSLAGAIGFSPSGQLEPTWQYFPSVLWQ